MTICPNKNIMLRIFKYIKLWSWERRHPLNKSRHLKDYVEISKIYGLSVQCVHRIAHGFHPENIIEHHVMNELIERGIIR